MLEGSKLLFTHFFQLFSWKSFLHNAPSLWDKGHSLKEGQEVHMESTNFTQEQKLASITMRVSKAGRGMRDELRTGQRLLSTEARCWIPEDSSCSSQLWATFDNFHQFSSVTQSHPTLCNPMNHSTPGLPVHHQLLESTQTHVHWVGDAIQPSHHLSSPSPPALNLSQHQGLFKWVSSSKQVAKGLEFQLQHQSFQWTPRTDFL